MVFKNAHSALHLAHVIAKRVHGGADVAQMLKSNVGLRHELNIPKAVSRLNCLYFTRYGTIESVLCHRVSPKRDGRDKPGHDKRESYLLNFLYFSRCGMIKSCPSRRILSAS